MNELRGIWNHLSASGTAIVSIQDGDGLWSELWSDELFHQLLQRLDLTAKLRDLDVFLVNHMIVGRPPDMRIVPVHVPCSELYVIVFC